MHKTFNQLLLLILVLANNSIIRAQAEQTMGGVVYGMAKWPESGFGNHRAVVEVTSNTGVVRARIPWRRHDANFRGKAVLVYDLATDKRIKNAFACNLTRECGDVVFQPQTTPGQYAIYYMPYEQPKTTAHKWKGRYLPVDIIVVFDSNTAKISVSTENTATLPEAQLDGFPQARLVRMESRLYQGERPNMNSFFPMEIIASEKELTELLARHTDSVLLFPEDQSRPVVMPDFIPQKWALDGPQDTFIGKCQPSEYYCWQIGVYAVREDIHALSLEYSDVKDTSGKTVIPSDGLTCFNLKGKTIYGKDFTKDFTLGKGMIRPL